jgi:DNA-binding response OmpR family regulator
LVALTGYGSDRDRVLSLNAGFDTHLVKPVTLEALEALLLAAGNARPPMAG